MVKYIENGPIWVKENLNKNIKELYKKKGCCRFTSHINNTYQGIYRVFQPPIEIPGNIIAKIEVQDMPTQIDSNYYLKIYDSLKSLIIILVCELINEVKAWNTGSIKQKRAHIQQAHYKNIQSEDAIKIIMTEALKVILIE